MAENSKIEWATHTFNHVRGCTKISPGCTRVVAAEATWKEPMKWNMKVDCNVMHGGYRPRVFCASLADVFEDWDGPMMASGNVILNKEYRASTGDLTERITMQDVRNRLFRLIDQTPNLDWLLLTKRPENIIKMIPERGYQKRGQELAGLLQNIWIGASCENQQAADERIPHLLRVPAAVRFLSCEPLLGPVDLRGKDTQGSALDAYEDDPKINWVVVGGESGPGSRPMDLAWARSIVEQCKAAGVACFVKQLGADPRSAGYGPGERLDLKDKKGGDMAEWPADLCIREFPR